MLANNAHKWSEGLETGTKAYQEAEGILEEMAEDTQQYYDDFGCTLIEEFVTENLLVGIKVYELSPECDLDMPEEKREYEPIAVQLCDDYRTLLN